MDYKVAKKILLERIETVGIENCHILDCHKRVLASDLITKFDVPNFEKSPLDGFCFRAWDTKNASVNSPLEFEIIDEVPCGFVSNKKIGAMQSIKILTGAKLPEGADCVCKYEDTEFNEKTVKIFRPFESGENIIHIGEDIKKGVLFAKKGDIVDYGIVGISASLGIEKLEVYKKLKVGIISTGTELVEVGNDLRDGKIYNSNRYVLESILKNMNMDLTYFGIVKDDINKLEEVYKNAIENSDIVISTGGVSVGDYDLINSTFKRLGFEIIVDSLEIKPGMACLIANSHKKLIFALSGNPMSAITSFYAVCLPAIKKMMGYTDYENKKIKVILKNSYNNKSGMNRFLRCKIYQEGEKNFAIINDKQGNIMLNSMIGCNGFVMVEKKTEAREGMVLDALLIS